MVEDRHGWWWHLAHDSVRDNPWSFLALLLIFAAIGCAFWVVAGWSTRSARRTLRESEKMMKDLER